MEIKKINLSLYKTLKLAIDLKIDLQLTPGQCKELIDFIDNPLVVEECCEWKEVFEYTSATDNEGFWWISTKCDWKYPEHYDMKIADLCLDTIEQFVKIMGFTKCPNCGKRIKYVEVE